MKDKGHSVESITISKAKGDKGFVKLFRACTDAVIEDLAVEDGRIRLLFWFIKQVQDKIISNEEHIILAHISDMAKALDSSEISVRRWLQILIDRGYIARHTHNNKTVYSAYVINKNYIYKGVLSKI